MRDMMEFYTDRCDKKEKQKKKSMTRQAIGDLEIKHKQSLAIETATALLDLWKKQQTLLILKAQKIFFKKGFFYEHGDKAGKFLVKALKDTMLSNIAAIKTSNGQVTQDKDCPKIPSILYRPVQSTKYT